MYSRAKHGKVAFGRDSRLLVKIPCPKAGENLCSPAISERSPQLCSLSSLFLAMGVSVCAR